MQKTAAMIVTQEENGTYTVLDASGNLHEASSEKELGELCSKIVNDPNLPKFETKYTQVEGMEDVALRVAEIVIPETYNFMVVPAVGLLKRAVDKIQRSNLVGAPKKIRSTPEMRREGEERVRRRSEEKERKKEEAKELLKQRRKAGPRSNSLRLGGKSV